MKVKLCREAWWGKGVYKFHCPGCDHEHHIWTDPSNPCPNKEKSCWGFNGNVEAPTFSPSLLWRIGSHVPGLTEKEIAYASESGPHWNMTCHSFIENGFIRILSDSTFHPNETLELDNIPRKIKKQ